MSINCCTEFIKPITSKSHKVGTYVGFGPPDIPDAPIGAVYFDTDANEMWVFDPKTQWIYMANYGEHKTTAAKNITNCRNCGAPVRGCKCEYCGTRY